MGWGVVDFQQVHLDVLGVIEGGWGWGWGEGGGFSASAFGGIGWISECWDALGDLGG